MGLLQKCVFQQKQKIRTGSCRLIRTLGVGVVWVRTEIRFRNVGALITRTGFGVYYGYNKEPPIKPILIIKAPTFFNHVSCLQALSWIMVTERPFSRASFNAR